MQATDTLAWRIPPIWFTNRFDTDLEKNDSGVPKSFDRWPFRCTEHAAMKLVADGSTSPTLLREVSDWQDHSAWVSFRDRYDPLLRLLVPRLRPRRGFD